MPSLNPNCTKCELYKGARTVCVAGQGPPQAQIMIVGEAPGRNEDAYGVPFIGRAGDLLNELLLRTGFKREDCYITNVVKCRPSDAEGKDRTPNSKEVKACLQYLYSEIKSVQPRYIVALGGPAIKALTGAKGVGVNRGSLLPLRTQNNADLPKDIAANVSVFGTVHPAAGLRYRHFLQQTEDDLKQLRRTIDDNFVEVNVPWQPGNEVHLTQVPTDVWGFDLETNGVRTRDPFSQVYLCAIDCGSDHVQVFDGHGLHSAAGSLKFFSSVPHGPRPVAHNGSAFDRLMIRREFGLDVHCDDTMLMEWLLHEEWGAPTVKKLNLEALAISELGARPWKKDVTWDWSNPATIPWGRAKEYCARDTRYCRLLALDAAPKLREQGLWEFYDKLLLPASRALADMEERGLLINNEHVADAKQYYQKKAAQNLAALKETGLQYGLNNFNPGSTQQVANLLFEKMGYAITDKTKGGKASTAVGVIKNLREMYTTPFFDHLLQYRKCRNKMLGTYIAHYEEEQDYFGRWFPWYSLVQTATGRTSSNAQQLPRPENGPMIRRCVSAPPGAVLLEVDFSQLEMRVAASRYVFDEPNLRHAFENDLDVHLLLAAEITGKRPEDVIKKERDNAKPPNFMFLYGGEENMYIRTLLEDQDIVKPFDVARAERDAFFRRWPGLPAGHARVVQELKQAGQIRTLFGTLRRLPNVYSDDRKVQVEAYRQAVNCKVQAPACHLALIGLILLGAAGFQVRSFQHDAYLLWVEDSEAAVRAATAQIRELLERGVPEVMASVFGIGWDVPLKVDIKAGTAWTENDRAAWVA